MKTDKKSFLFYQSWKTQIDILDDSELRKFINNLLSYHDGGEVVLESKYDKLLWNGVLPGLEVNNLKYQKTIERNRENGKKGGRPKKEAAETEKPNGFIENLYKTDGFKEKPKKPDNSKVEIDNSKGEIDIASQHPNIVARIKRIMVEEHEPASNNKFKFKQLGDL